MTVVIPPDASVGQKPQEGLVLVFGTFDLLHPGHLDYFRQARTYGTSVICVIGRDKTVERVKGHLPKQSETERQAAVAASGLVDEAVLGDPDDMYAVLDRFKPAVICLGYDQTVFIKALPFELAKRNLLSTQIVRANPFKPEEYKSSYLRSDA